MKNPNDDTPQTPEEVAEDAKVNAEYDAFMAKAKAAFISAVPEGVDLERVINRAAYLSMLAGSTRTSMLGAAFHIAISSRIVGVDVKEMLKCIEAVDSALVEDPYVARRSVEYAKSNAEYHAKKEAEAASKAIFVGNGSTIVH